MPKLSLFTPCENVILSQDNNASLIQLLSHIKLTLPPEVPDPIPPHSAAPMKWFIYAQWECSPDEVGIRFEQKIDMVNELGEAAADFQLLGSFIPEAEKPIHRMIASLVFIPLYPPGQYRLRVSIRRAGEERWNLAEDQRLDILHERVAAQVAHEAR